MEPLGSQDLHLMCFNIRNGILFKERVWHVLKRLVVSNTNTFHL